MEPLRWARAEQRLLASCISISPVILGFLATLPFFFTWRRNLAVTSCAQPLFQGYVSVQSSPLSSLIHPSGLETVGQRNPQLPQGFVPVARSIIYPGDRLKVTCDFDSTSRTSPTMAGGTHNDEMCNM